MEDKISELNAITKEFNIDGIECYYSNFTEEQTNELINYCNQNNLLISGGSDYHGNNKPEISLGIGKGNLQVPSNIIDNW
ncbi:MAG: phosphoesterase, partial [Bacilli bacterium]|nr:phosphoesterase [Bacilli bacterium]